jgi:hypothetical protein
MTSLDDIHFSSSSVRVRSLRIEASPKFQSGIHATNMTASTTIYAQRTLWSFKQLCDNASALSPCSLASPDPPSIPPSDYFGLFTLTFTHCFALYYDTPSAFVHAVLRVSPFPSAAKVLLRHRFADSVLNQSSRRQCLLRYRLASSVGVLCFFLGGNGCIWLFELGYGEGILLDLYYIVLISI